MEEHGLFPERCPLCDRINFRNGPDYCAHWWGTEYDGSLIDGPFSEEYETLWTHLSEAYDTPDDIAAARLIARLKEAGLTRIAKALREFDKVWWLSGVEYRVYIEPQMSMVSGEGWSLYEEEPGWFVDIMTQLRKAAAIADLGNF
jgi:hypothetical protein